jgi:hypothetical protein
MKQENAARERSKRTKQQNEVREQSNIMKQRMKRMTQGVEPTSNRRPHSGWQ